MVAVDDSGAAQDSLGHSAVTIVINPLPAWSLNFRLLPRGGLFNAGDSLSVSAPGGRNKKRKKRSKALTRD